MKPDEQSTLLRKPSLDVPRNAQREQKPRNRPIELYLSTMPPVSFGSLSLGPVSSSTSSSYQASSEQSEYDDDDHFLEIGLSMQKTRPKSILKRILWAMCAMCFGAMVGGWVYLLLHMDDGPWAPQQ